MHDTGTAHDRWRLNISRSDAIDAVKYRVGIENDGFTFLGVDRCGSPTRTIGKVSKRTPDVRMTEVHDGGGH